MTARANSLRAIKLLHTIVWAFFAACIAAIPFVAWQRHFTATLWLIGIVLVEVAVLAANRWRCPLTAIAARYTPDRRDNFDIYLPNWLARYNKVIFGTLLVGGLIVALIRRLGWFG